MESLKEQHLEIGSHNSLEEGPRSLAQDCSGTAIDDANLAVAYLVLSSSTGKSRALPPLAPLILARQRESYMHMRGVHP